MDKKPSSFKLTNVRFGYWQDGSLVEVPLPSLESVQVEIEPLVDRLGKFRIIAPIFSLSWRWPRLWWLSSWFKREWPKS